MLIRFYVTNKILSINAIKIVSCELVCLGHGLRSNLSRYLVRRIICCFLNARLLGKVLLFFITFYAVVGFIQSLLIYVIYLVIFVMKAGLFSTMIILLSDCIYEVVLNANYFLFTELYCLNIPFIINSYIFFYFNQLFS